MASQFWQLVEPRVAFIGSSVIDSDLGGKLMYLSFIVTFNRTIDAKSVQFHSYVLDNLRYLGFRRITSSHLFIHSQLNLAATRNLLQHFGASESTTYLGA